MCRFFGPIEDSHSNEYSFTFLPVDSTNSNRWCDYVGPVIVSNEQHPAWQHCLHDDQQHYHDSHRYWINRSRAANCPANFNSVGAGFQAPAYFDQLSACLVGGQDFHFDKE